MVRILGSPGRSRQLRSAIGLTFSLVLVAMFLIPSALAVHDDDIFQLDRNAVTADPGDPATVGEDWDLVCPDTHANGAAECLGGTTADTSKFVDDFPPANSTIFTGGGSKDDLSIQGGPWLSKNGSVPDKDNLLHGYAARYDDHLYFGADRSAANGDAALGVWFFQSPVAPGTGGGTQPFVGEHVNGDVLVLTDFTGGGGTVTARVFKWHSPGGAINGTLDLIQGTDNPPTPADCVGLPQVPDNDNACATVNNENEDSPWAYQAKEQGSPAGVFPPGHFFEGGIDLTGLGLAEECFSSFLIETRSSQSVDSVLKDFVAGQFELCGATITTNAQDDADGAPFEIGDTITDTATVHVTGGSTPAPEGFVDFYICGPSATVISSCDANGTPVSSEDLAGAVEDPVNSFSVTSDAVTLNVAGNYCFYAEYPAGQDTNYPNGAFLTDFTDECFAVAPNQPAILTQVSDAGPVNPGTAVSDTAAISGLATPSTGTGGTITFNAYGPDDATCATSVYTSTVSNVVANASYNSFTDGDAGTVAFAPTQPGTYRWIASYTPGAGDVNNLPASTACNDPNESFVVQQFNPALTTTQTVTITDSATITVNGGGNLVGTAYIQPFSDSSCTAGNELATQQSFPVNGASPQTVTTTAMTILDPGEPTIYWQVSYDSDNPAQTDIAATCTENSSIVIND